MERNSSIERFVERSRQIQADRKSPVFRMMKSRMNRYRESAEDLESRIPKFSAKDVVWISSTEQGIIKKVEGTWNDRLKRVVAKYYVRVYSGKKKKILVLTEKEISKNPEYFIKKA